jgi:uncharacterized membrane protein YjdF
MEKKFLNIDKIRKLEELIAWLYSYESDGEEEHFVGESPDQIDIDKTILLKQLGELNAKRKVLIQKILN